jgi:hypothetical protein
MLFSCKRLETVTAWEACAPQHSYVAVSATTVLLLSTAVACVLLTVLPR